MHRLNDASFLAATSKEFWNNPQNGEYTANVVRLIHAIEIVKAGGMVSEAKNMGVRR